MAPLPCPVLCVLASLVLAQFSFAFCHLHPRSRTPIEGASRASVEATFAFFFVIFPHGNLEISAHVQKKPRGAARPEPLAWVGDKKELERGGGRGQGRGQGQRRRSVSCRVADQQTTILVLEDLRGARSSRRSAGPLELASVFVCRKRNVDRGRSPGCCSGFSSVVSVSRSL